VSGYAKAVEDLLKEWDRLDSLPGQEGRRFINTAYRVEAAKDLAKAEQDRQCRLIRAANRG
jgi:hypothetical protein